MKTRARTRVMPKRETPEQAVARLTDIVGNVVGSMNHMAMRLAAVSRKLELAIKDMEALRGDGK